MRKLTVLALTLVACGDSSSSCPEPAFGGNDAGGEDAAAERDAGNQGDSGAFDGGAARNDAGDQIDAGSTIDAGHEIGGPLDAGVVVTDAGADAEIDAAPDAATCPTVLLSGGSDLATQGWSTTMQAPSNLTLGADYVRLETSTTSGASTSGQLLLSYPGAVESNMPFKVQIVMQVESVHAHNRLDSAAAILGSFTPSSGTQIERSEMVYLDSASLGWGDDTQSAAAAVVDGQYHTYVLSVDAQQVAHVSRDGVELLTRNGFTTNGTIAIGDQTNDPNIDAVVRIQSVSKLCL